MFGIDITILAVMGLAGFAVAAVAYALFFNQIDAGAKVEKRVAEFASAPIDRAARGKDPTAVRRRNVQDTLKEIEEKQKAKAEKSTRPALRLRLEQAGLQISPRRFVAISAGVGVGLVLVGFLLGLPLFATFGLGFVGALGLPRFFVDFKRKRRQKAFLDELPNAVEVIVRGVKAGLPLNDCLRMIASEAKDPLRSEFRGILDGLSVGLPIDEAVTRIYERMPLPEANFFAIVIAIQSKAGGNLSEALSNLARVLRDRKKMRAKINAMSMEAKASASIIGSLPIIVGILVYVTSPDYIAVLWTDPIGHITLGASALTMMAGIFVMRQMINFDI